MEGIGTSTSQRQSTPEKVPDLWFDDCGLVIQAENSLYRVSRSILAARSSVFRDMLSFPQPENAELVESCPCVSLPDSAADVTVFLTALFDSSYSFHQPPPARTEAHIITGVLRLSNKYDVPGLRRRALLHLSSAFPTTLDQYNEIKNSRTFPAPTKPSVDLALAQVILEMDVLWLLPVALYECGSWDMETFFKSVDMSGGLVRKCAFGYQNRYEASMKLLGTLLTADAAGCRFHSQCNSARKAILPRYYDAAILCLSQWREVVGSDFMSKACTSCRENSKSLYDAARVDVWNRLPEMYGLPSWEALEKLKEAAFK